MDRRTFTTWCALVLLCGCGGSSSGAAPVLSNLIYAPHVATPGVPVTVSFSADVDDVDADVVRIEVSGSDGSGAQLEKTTHEVQNAPGQARTTVLFHVRLAAPAAGRCTIVVQAFDAGARGSNQLQATVSVDQPPPPSPFVNFMSPSTATAGDPGFSLSVSGSNFTPTSVVEWNGSPRTTTFFGPGQLQAQIGAADLATPGTAQVTVRTPGAAPSNAASFLISAPAPLAATFLFPSSVVAGSGAFSLQVQGTSFVQGAVVQWNGSARSTQFFSSTALQAQITAADVATVGTAQVTVVNPGGAATAPLTFDVTAPPPLSATFLFPSSTVAGSGAFTLQVQGTSFARGAVVQWNGSARSTQFIDSTMLFAQIGAADVAVAGTVQVTVVNPDTSATAPLTFTISAPPPLALGSIFPQSAFAGTQGFTLQASGTSFTPSSVVQWNGSARPTTFVNSSFLLAQIPASDLASGGTAQVTVADVAPPAVSSALPFQIQTQPGVTLVSLSASDMAWDPWQRRIYLSIPSTAPANPNTIAVVDPFTAQVTAAQFAGSEPHALAISDDGQFLYAGLDGAAAVKRFALPGLAPDATGSFSLPAGTFGPLVARDIEVAPGAPRTIAVALAQTGSSASSAGVAIYDDAAERPTTLPGFNGTGNSFDTLAWGADAGTLFAANNETTGANFYRLAVSAAGVSVALDAPGAAGAFFGLRIHFAPSTGLVYTDAGRVLDGDGVLQGTFTSTGSSGAMAPDGELNRAYFFLPFPFNSSTNFRTFDLTHFTPAGELAVQGLPFAPSVARVLRFGADGVAVLVSGQLVLVRGALVLPVSATPNPAPSIASLAPATAPAGAANLRVVLTGTGFVPGSVVRWNGAERSTSFRGPTQLVAFVPASDLAAAGSAQVTVVSPTPGGGTSPATTFTIAP